MAYVRKHRGWFYLAVVMDIWSRGIVGWSVVSRLGAGLADGALGMAVAGRRRGINGIGVVSAWPSPMRFTDPGTHVLAIRERAGGVDGMCNSEVLGCL